MGTRVSAVILYQITAIPLYYHEKKEYIRRFQFISGFSFEEQTGLVFYCYMVRMNFLSFAIIIGNVTKFSKKYSHNYWKPTIVFYKVLRYKSSPIRITSIYLNKNQLYGRIVVGKDGEIMKKLPDGSTADGKPDPEKLLELILNYWN